MTQVQTVPVAVGRPDRQLLVLAVVVVAEVMDTIDGTIVNVAAPAIRRDLGGGPATLSWLVAAYTLAFALLLITGGRVGDRIGRRRAFLIGVGGFTAASVACALAPDTGWLIGLRALQGSSAALIIPQSFGLLRAAFPADALGRAFAAFGPAIGLSAVAAPFIGGGLLSLDVLGLGWRAVFVVNGPVGLAVVVGGRRVLPPTPAVAGTHLDPGGIILATGAAFAVVFPLIEGSQLGWPLWLFALLATGLAGFVGLLRHERRHASRALIAPDLMRNPTFATGLLASVSFFSVMIGLGLVVPLFCQLGERFSPLHTGLALAPLPLGMVFTAPVSSALANRLGRAVMQIGLLVMGAGLVVLAGTVHAAGAVVGAWTLCPGELLVGAGIGLVLPPLFGFVLAGVADRDVGSASGVLSAVQQFGGSLGVAGFAALYLSLRHAHPAPTAMEVVALGALVPLAACFVALFRLPARPRVTAPGGAGCGPDPAGVDRQNPGCTSRDS